MTNKERELIRQLTEVAMIVAELKAENKILKDINEKLMQALRMHDVVGRSTHDVAGQSEQLVCDRCNGGHNNITPCPKCGGVSESLFETN